MRPSVSVALCTHNGARYIEEQLRSILSQTFPPTEVVVSDDASSDDTVQRVQEIWERLVQPDTAPVLRLLRNDTALGVTKNFERALTACTGDLIALSDQDDRWHPTRVEQAVQIFEASPKLLLLHADAELVDTSGAPLGITLSSGLEISQQEIDDLLSGNAIRALMRRNLVTGATAMIRRELLAVATPFPEPWVHDEWLAMVASALGRLGYLPEAVIDYRQHEKNQIGVRKLSLRGKVRRLTEPRNGRYDYLLARAEVLLDRLQTLPGGPPPVALGLASDKVSHQMVRASLSHRRLVRVLPVLREAATGRYSRFSRGTADILRDLLQPAGGSTHA